MTPKRKRERVSQLAVQASCVRSTRNLRETFIPNPASFAFKANSGFLVPAVPNFCKVGPPAELRGQAIVNDSQESGAPAT